MSFAGVVHNSRGEGRDQGGGVPGSWRQTASAIACWLAFGATVAAIGFVLLRACAIAPLGFALSFCPAASPVLAAATDRTNVLSSQANDMERELARRRLACASRPKPAPPPLSLPDQPGAPRPQQTALLKPPPPPPPPKSVEPPKPPAALPADRWARKDLSMLQGCWVLGHPTPWSIHYDSGSVEHCTATAGALCFGSNGTGTLQTSVVGCPRHAPYQCTSPTTARFADNGTLLVDQQSTPCSSPGITSVPSELTCHRVDDQHASCESRSRFGSATLDFRKGP